MKAILGVPLRKTRRLATILAIVCISSPSVAGGIFLKEPRVNGQDGPAEVIVSESFQLCAMMEGYFYSGRGEESVYLALAFEPLDGGPHGPLAGEDHLDLFRLEAHLPAHGGGVAHLAAGRLAQGLGPDGPAVLEDDLVGPGLLEARKCSQD